LNKIKKLIFFLIIKLLILDIYFNIIETNFPKQLIKNANAQSALVVSYFLNKIFQHQNLVKLNNKKQGDQSNSSYNMGNSNELLSSSLHLSNELNLFIIKLNAMINKAFIINDLNDTTKYEKNELTLVLKDFDLFVNYSNQELFNLFNNFGNNFKLFHLLFILIKICFSKCHLTFKKLNNLIVKEIEPIELLSASEIKIENENIKNIDDNSSDDDDDDDDKQDNKENKNTEDLDDYYMISNLFDEHQSNQNNLPLTTISTNQSNSDEIKKDKHDSTKIVNKVQQNKSTINESNSPNTTQQTNNQESNVNK
jgi:hypothetical protein